MYYFHLPVSGLSRPARRRNPTQRQLRPSRSQRRTGHRELLGLRGGERIRGSPGCARPGSAGPCRRRQVAAANCLPPMHPLPVFASHGASWRWTRSPAPARTASAASPARLRRGRRGAPPSQRERRCASLTSNRLAPSAPGLRTPCSTGKAQSASTTKKRSDILEADRTPFFGPLDLRPRLLDLIRRESRPSGKGDVVPRSYAPQFRRRVVELVRGGCGQAPTRQRSITSYTIEFSVVDASKLLRSTSSSATRPSV